MSFHSIDFQTSARRRARPAGGFTLIELLVVLGIIALFVGVISIGLRGGDQTYALRSAQGTVGGLLKATRGQAVLNQTDARFIVHADSSDPERYLRFVGIVVWRPDDQGNLGWMPSGTGTLLPGGIRIVPPRQPHSLQSLGVLADSVNWPDHLTSNILIPPTPQFEVAFNEGDDRPYYFIEFRSNGKIQGLNDGFSAKIAIAPARVTPQGPRFDNPEHVIGMLLRSTGQYTLLNQPRDFPEN
ncbi:MAG: prepilin-type N-terminal cleavage/methylation domain-containing protein [Puniceicoccaceae bacterium]|nr:MAG: prepilin-type N-terminal cleavage/methylation domain-containing protein [Puniceicoccaceae bacterium]